MARYLILGASLAVALLVISTAPVDAARLPPFLCNAYRDLFVNSGCVKTETAFCRFLNVRITSVVRGEPACDDFPCQGYVGDIGKCVKPINCLVRDTDGICNSGAVCCLQGRPGGNGGNDGNDGNGSDSSDESGSNESK